MFRLSAKSFGGEIGPEIMTTRPSPNHESPIRTDVLMDGAIPTILTPRAARVLLELVRQAARYLRVEDVGEDAA